MEYPRVQLIINIVIPLFIYTCGATSRSRDKFRVVHSAIATLVVNRSFAKISNRYLNTVFVCVFVINSIFNLKLFFNVIVSILF